MEHSTTTGASAPLPDAVILRHHRWWESHVRPEHDLTPLEREVLHHHVRAADGLTGRNCWGSHSIAFELDRHPGAVRRAERRLEELGLIKVNKLPTAEEIRFFADVGVEKIGRVTTVVGYAEGRASAGARASIRTDNRELEHGTQNRESATTTRKPPQRRQRITMAQTTVPVPAEAVEVVQPPPRCAATAAADEEMVEDEGVVVWVNEHSLDDDAPPVNEITNTLADPSPVPVDASEGVGATVTRFDLPYDVRQALYALRNQPHVRRNPVQRDYIGNVLLGTAPVTPGLEVALRRLRGEFASQGGQTGGVTFGSSGP